MTENSAAMVSGIAVKKRFADFLYDTHEEEARSGDEIAAEVIKKIGLEVVD